MAVEYNDEENNYNQVNCSYSLWSASGVLETRRYYRADHHRSLD